MATLLTPAQTNLPEPRLLGSAQVAAGLAALLIGGAMLLGSAVPPDVQAPSVVAPFAAAIATAGGLDAAWHNADRTPRSPSRRIPPVDRSRADRHAMADMSSDRTQVELETALPDGWEVRWDLMEMAAAQRRDWTLRCPCPVYPVDQPVGGPR